jgi:hypothetical protein
MSSSEQVDDAAVGMSGSYVDSTEESRNSVDPHQPLLDTFTKFASDIAKTLNNQFIFLEEDSEPVDHTGIRAYMMQELDDLWNTRQSLLADLREYFTDENIVRSLSGVVKDTSVTMTTCLKELDSIRIATKKTLGNAVRAAWDDLSSENVASEQRQKSRSAALESLQSLAANWKTLSEELSTAKKIGSQRRSG